MCPSLIEIGSKTAEKNSAQTNRQTDRQYENNGHLAVNQQKKSLLSQINRAMFRVTANVLQTKLDAQCDKLATVKLSWQHLQQLIFHGEKAEKSEFGSNFQRKVPLFLETPEFPYNTTWDTMMVTSVLKPVGSIQLLQHIHNSGLWQTDVRP